MYISLVGLKDTDRRIVVLVAPPALLGQSTIIPLLLPVREVGYPLLMCISMLGGRAVSILILEIEVQTKEYMILLHPQ